MNQDTKVVKISDVIENQIPEFILSENPNFVEFLKQYYISQEYQGATVDIVENLSTYKNIDSFDSTNLIETTSLSDDVSYFDDVIYVKSTYGWPSQYGLLKIDDEIITYTGITTNSFTGCIRGFSGVESLSDPRNPENLKFSSTEIAEHSENSTVSNLSNLFLIEFFKKIKYQFAPGFEELDFDSRIDVPNFISKVKNFYQTKGTDEAFQILFKVLYGKHVEVVKPRDYLFTTSDDEWIVVERYIAEAIEGNPLNLNGQTLYQDKTGEIEEANGSIYKVSSVNLKGTQYYNIDIFSGYTNNLNPKGSIFGKFETTPKTYCSLEVSATDSTISAVSTIGFPQSGTIIVGDYSITYGDKTSTEFLNCTGISTSISLSTPIYGENFVYSYEEGDIDKKVKLRIFNTLSEIDKSNSILANKDDLLKVDNIGQIQESSFTKSLRYNVPSIIFADIVYDTLPEGKFGVEKSTGKVRTKYPHYLRNGDIVEVYSITEGKKLFDTTISNVNNQTYNQFTIGSSSNLTLNHKLKLKRKVLKSSSSQFSDVNKKFAINVQNSYEDLTHNYITSNGFTSGNINPYKKEYIVSIGSTDTLISTSFIGNHNFYDGELISVSSFSTVGTFENNVGIYTGISLYAKKIDASEIKLAFTKQDILNDNYINFVETTDEINSTVSGYIGSLTLTVSSLYNSTFTSTKLFKKFPKEVKSNTKDNLTRLGSVGVFVNGIEIQNYKSFDRLYNGEITSIDTLNGGDGYSLVNTPRFEINAGDDTTTILTPDMVGSIKSISVVDPGFDYIETPIITIQGGGNSSVKTEVKLTKIQKELEFNSEDPNKTIITDPFNQFVFDEPHQLSPGDAVIYETFGNSPIGNLRDEGVYYVFDVGAGTSFKLASNKTDALSGIGTINLGAGAKGIHRFTSVDFHNVIDTVSVIDANAEFKYRKIPLLKNNINHYDDIIEFNNHGFVDGDEVEYSFTGSPIIFTSGYFYIVKLDDNKFRLSSTEDLSTIVNLSAPNSSSIHYISYSPIRTTIRGQLSTLGITTIGSEAIVEPIVTGSIKKLNITNSQSYGNTIFNFENSPKISVVKGKYASFKPIISNGRIIKVLVLNSGQNYYNSVSLNVIGTGTGAKLHPIITDGEIVDVVVLSSGVGYDQYTQVKPSIQGKGAEFKANLKYWTINEVSKHSSTNLEKGILIGQNYYDGKSNVAYYYLTNSLKTDFGINSTSHSSIIGWAYDGCPIYGPYAYKNADGTGGIVEMKSSYKNIKVSPSIPNSTSIKCVEDYTYTKNYGTLDEFNGRYCVTPEFPKGVYAYFATSAYPYFIGPSYRYEPTVENFELTHTQDLYLNNLGIVKHTFPYYIKDKENYYEYFEFYPNTAKEDFVVLDVLGGNITDIDVISSGEGYSIGDKITFNNTGTEGFGASAKVSELLGVGVSSISSETIDISNIQFIQSNSTITGITTAPVDLKDNYYIGITSVSSSEYYKLEGTKKISVKNISSKLRTPLEANTGIVTSISITDPITNFDIDSHIKIGTETLVVVGLDYLNNLIEVKRGDEANSASAQSDVFLKNNKFTFTEKTNLNLTEKNESYYFSSSLVSIGNTNDTGIGNQITKYPLGPGTPESKFVKYAGIWLPNHKFKTGDKVKYELDSSSSTIYTNNGNLIDFANLYVVDLGNDVIGLVAEKSYTSSTDNLLYFTYQGNGPLHKLTTIRNVVTGSAVFNQSVITTTENHGLSVDDVVKLNVKSGITSTFTVTYSSSQARLKVNSANNPKISAYRNQTLEFNISSSTLSGSEFRLYTDDEFKNEYIGNSISGIEVSKSSTKVSLKISDNTPSKLYYNIKTSNTLYQDIDVQGANSIDILQSKYNSIVGIVSTTNNTFTVNLENEPESESYVSVGQTSISYYVLDSEVVGPISDVRMVSNGQDYKKLPSIESVGESGKNAVLVPITNDIGKINRIETISNITYSSDKTLKPFSNLYSALYLSENYKVSKINLDYGGKNYLSPPVVQVYNEIEDKIYTEVSAYSTLNTSTVEEVFLVNGGTGLLKDGNKVVFTNNTNGLNILDAYYVQTAPNVFLVSLQVETPTSGFTTSSPIPFQIGDEIFVEGVQSLGSGFNSSDYSYNTFEVVGIVTAYSSPNEAIIRYELPNAPGSLVSVEDSHVINSKDIPTCSLVMGQSSFYPNEVVNSTNSVNNISNNISNTTVNVYDSSMLEVGDLITGKDSGTKAKIIKISPIQSTFTISNGKSKSSGWNLQRGNLSEIVQKLPDNDYYQNFSYSLKSTQQISDWESPVSDLVHVAGLKKFGDLVVESNDPTSYKPTSLDNSDINLAITSYVDANTINNFDLVLEDVEDHNNLYSETLKFKTQKLTDYLLCEKNRVLEIDDISLNFDTDIPFVSITLDELPVSASVVAKYISFIESTSSLFTDFDTPAFAEVFMTGNGTDVNLITYSYFEELELGIYTADLDKTNKNILLQFIPYNVYNIISSKVIKETIPIAQITTVNNYGNTSNVAISTSFAPESVPTQHKINLCSLTDCTSGTAFVGISSVKGYIQEFSEFTFVYDGQGIDNVVYSTNELFDLGEVGISTGTSNNIELTYTGIANTTLYLYANVHLLTNVHTDPEQQSLEFGRVNSSRVQFTASTLSPVGICSIGIEYGVSKYAIEVTKTIGVTTERSIIQINSIHYDIIPEQEKYLNNVNYGLVGNYDDLNFSTIFDANAGTYTLTYYPNDLATYDIKFYEKSILRTTNPLL